MLLFSTLLPINQTLTPEAFIKLVIEWNQSSPHPENVIPNVTWNGERNVRYGNEKLWLDIEEDLSRSIVAVRYEKREESGVVWDTDYVANFAERKVAIRLDRSYTQDAPAEMQAYSTPHFITLLINGGFLQNDGDMGVQREPHICREDEIGKLAEIIKGERRYALPVVYVSRTARNEEPVDVPYLASRLKGVAHVIAQEDHAHNTTLRALCDDRNDFNGAIGVYYPNPSIPPKKFLYHCEEGHDEVLMERVCRCVIQFSSSKMLDTLYTWQGATNAILRDRLQAQREERIAAEQARRKAEEETNRLLDSLDEKEQQIKKKALDEAMYEANTLIESTDEEMKDLQRRVDELTRANEALLFENQGLKAKLDMSDAMPVIHMGDEYDAYQGEIKDIILTILEEAIANLYPNSRRMHIVQDVIQSNDFKHQTDKNAEEAKRLLKSYSGMPAKLRQDIERLGFEISDDGKHYKLRYHGDGRYTVTIAKTPSDGRSGKNTLQDLIHLVF